MLALSRKKDEAIIINDDIEITIIEIKGDQVKLGISAPSQYLYIVRKCMHRYLILIRKQQVRLMLSLLTSYLRNDLFYLCIFLSKGLNFT